MPQNAEWYDLNSGRAYPLDDAATATDDQGATLPENILSDIYLRFPSTLGQYAFLSSVAVTPTLTSLTILASDSLNSVGNFQPVAVLSVMNPAVGQLYALEPQYPGVGGWAAFGDGIVDTPGSYRFSLPNQSFLARRAAQTTRGLPVRSVSCLEASPVLTGIVRLTGGNDIEIVKECREIPITLLQDSCDPESDVARNVIVIRLVNTQTNSAGDRNVLSLYTGPCGGRPESRTCGDPQPIENINGVQPDCCGNINILLKGCAVPGEIVGGGGIVIDCGTGLADACVNQLHLPTVDGVLPNEFAGQCDGEISDLSIC